MPKKSSDSSTSAGFQLPSQFAHLPSLVTTQRATLAERDRLADLHQRIAAEITTFSQTGDVEDLDALGSIVVKQAQAALLPSRLAFLDANIAESDAELADKFKLLRRTMKPLALEIRRAYVEIYARRQQGDGIALEVARQTGWNGLPKSKETAQYEGQLDGPDGFGDYPSSVSDLLKKLGAWTGERDALTQELGGAIPAFNAVGLDAFREIPVAAPAQLFYGKREVTPEELAELRDEEGEIRAQGWDCKSRASLMSRRGEPHAPAMQEIAERFLALVAGNGDNWTTEQVQAVRDDFAALEEQMHEKL